MTGTPDKIERARRPIRKFNPGTLQSDGEVIEQFVVRKPELQTVLDVLRGNIDSPSCQHVLIVAPRGRGKTMLLARAAAELRTNDAFSKFLLPVRFMEESLEIFNLADFWLETLFHLAGEIADTHPGLARELRDTHASLASRWREQGLHDHARAAVLEATDRLGRQLVLMLENLHSLSRNVHEDFGWQLRAVLQSEPQVMLVASATTRFEALDDVTEPYFELFRIVSLQPLDTEDCRRLWQTLTGHLVPGRRIRPLEILTGGSPRLLVIVAGFAAHRSLRRLMEELVALIDEHTEYFRGHLEALPRSERRVYVALLDLWAPSNTGEIAARARMNVRVVSIMLKRLVDRGSIIVDPPGGSKRLYAAAEPLFSIYYKIRRERDEAAVVENLIRFMVAFYDHSVMFPVIDRIFSEARESSALHMGIERALARKRSDEDLRQRMVWDRLQDVSDKVRDARHDEARVQLQDAAATAFRDQDWERVIELVEQYAGSEWMSASEDLLEHEFAYLMDLKADAYLGMKKYEKVVELGGLMIERYRESRDLFLLFRSARVLLNKSVAHFNLRDHMAMIASVRELVDWFEEFNNPQFQRIVGDALMLQARAETERDDFEAADSVLDDVVRRFNDSNSPQVQERVVTALLEKAGNVPFTDTHFETVIAIIDQAIERFDKIDVIKASDTVAMAFMYRAFARAELGDIEGEIESYKEMIDLVNTSGRSDTKRYVAHALASMSIRLVETDRVDAALKACSELELRLGALDRNDYWKAWLTWTAMCVRALALMARQDTSAALDAFRSAYTQFPTDHDIFLYSMVRIVGNLIELGAPERSLIDVLAGDSTKARAVFPLITALRQRAGEPVRAPTEVLEVAADIGKTIEGRISTGALAAF